MQIKTISITYSLLQKYAKMNSCGQLSVNSKVNKIFNHNGELIVITGSISSWNEGYISIWGNIVVPLAEYKGTVPALDHDEHRDKVSKGEIERGYTGLIIRNKNQKFVLERPIKFIPKKCFEPKQLLLF